MREREGVVEQVVVGRKVLTEFKTLIQFTLIAPPPPKSSWKTFSRLVEKSYYLIKKKQKSVFFGNFSTARQRNSIFVTYEFSHSADVSIVIAHSNVRWKIRENLESFFFHNLFQGWPSEAKYKTHSGIIYTRECRECFYRGEFFCAKFSLIKFSISVECWLFFICLLRLKFILECFQWGSCNMLQRQQIEHCALPVKWFRE